MLIFYSVFSLTVSYRFANLVEILKIQIKNRSERSQNELYIFNLLKIQHKYGGGGGSRTRVRKHSA